MVKRVNQNGYRIETSVGNTCNFVAIVEATKALPFKKSNRRVYKKN